MPRTGFNEPPNRKLLLPPPPPLLPRRPPASFCLDFFLILLSPRFLLSLLRFLLRAPFTLSLPSSRSSVALRCSTVAGSSSRRYRCCRCYLPRLLLLFFVSPFWFALSLPLPLRSRDSLTWNYALVAREYEIRRCSHARRAYNEGTNQKRDPSV